jgi:hypothetical protein
LSIFTKKHIWSPCPQLESLQKEGVVYTASRTAGGRKHSTSAEICRSIRQQSNKKCLTDEMTMHFLQTNEILCGQPDNPDEAWTSQRILNRCNFPGYLTSLPAVLLSTRVFSVVGKCSENKLNSCIFVLSLCFEFYVCMYVCMYLMCWHWNSLW